MPQPTINDLEHPLNEKPDKVTILSDYESMPAARKVVPIAPAAPPPAPPTKRKRLKKGEPPYLQEEELARLFKAIDSPRDRAIFRLAYHAGLRASEIGMLQLREYNPRTDRIYVHRLKGSNSGEHHLCRPESRALIAWLKIRGSAPGAIFYSQKGTPISRKRLDELMKQYGAAANIPPKLRHFHVLKHCCATHLFTKGFNVEQVQDWMGHVNIQNTLKYGKVTNARREQMAAQLRDAWK